jgi:NAD+ synthase (glutamine-hydrolysing)
VKIGVAQLNTSVGNLEGNANSIIQATAKAVEIDPAVDLVVCPELAITGYPPQDLILKSHFIDAQLDAASKVAREAKTPVLFGFIDRDRTGKIYNAAGFAIGGRIVQVFHKTLLPNYDVFDEKRYFTPAQENIVPLRVNGARLGVIICEDMWEDDYKTSVIEPLKERGADFIVNLSASPWNLGKHQTRINVVRRRISEYGLPILYVNQVGGQDELIFDGSSFYCDSTLLSKEKINYIAPFCQEHVTVVDIDVKHNKIISVVPFTDSFNYAGSLVQTFKALVLGTQDYARKNGFTKVILGLSGGIDSTLTAAIAKEAGLEVLGVSLPSHITDDSSRDEARKYAQRLGIGFMEIPIRDTFHSVVSHIENVTNERVRGIARENVQPRVRGLYLMALSNMYGHLLLSTGNKTEIALGYSTLYGDMCGGLAVIGDIEKPMVYGLCRYYNQLRGPIISEFVLNRTPTAELEAGQADPFDYPFISKVVDKIVEGHASPESILGSRKERGAEILDAFKRIKISQFKRKQSPPILRVSPKAFGVGRRMPIANGFQY